MYILYLVFKSRDKSRGGRGLVMLPKLHDKRRAVLECDRVEGEMQPRRDRYRRKEKKGDFLYAY